jgi:tRNA (guanine10-N2)-methyltransferase
MRSLARCDQPGCAVWDPFCGTGSLTVAAAALGAGAGAGAGTTAGAGAGCGTGEGKPVCAVALGSEIDPRVLRGKLGRNAVDNCAQYALPRPEQVRMDAAAPAFRAPRRGLGLFDAIVTDPPYGVRAGAKRPGASEESREQWNARRALAAAIDRKSVV